jgi:hypothetical protein
MSESDSPQSPILSVKNHSGYLTSLTYGTQILPQSPILSVLTKINSTKRTQVI